MDIEYGLIVLSLFFSKIKEQVKYLQVLVLISISAVATSQDVSYSNRSINPGISIGINEGGSEMGFGGMISFSYKHGVWKGDRLRLSPGIMTGNFMSLMVTDVPDYYYRLTSLGLNAELDLIRIGSLSLVIYGGGFVNYSRGLKGTGGWPQGENTYSDYFWRLYCGGSFGGGLRLNRPDSRFIYELYPLNFQVGPDYYMMGFTQFSLGIKLH